MPPSVSPLIEPHAGRRETPPRMPLERYQPPPEELPLLLELEPSVSVSVSDSPPLLVEPPELVPDSSVIGIDSEESEPLLSSVIGVVSEVSVSAVVIVVDIVPDIVAVDVSELPPSSPHATRPAESTSTLIRFLFIALLPQKRSSSSNP
jgi:hypothetical protein